MGELCVIVDRRERNQELIGCLEAKGLSIEVRTVPVGDYIVSDRVCVERKTVQDFESSITSGRLFEQLGRLREGYALPILLLEGDRELFRLGSNIINGAIISIYVDYGIPVIFTSGPGDTAEVIARMARREQSGDERLPSVKGNSRARSREQFQEFVVGNLPGVGPKLARALLAHFGSIRRIASASNEELMEVDKIGRKKAELVHDTLNREYDPMG